MTYASGPTTLLAALEARAGSTVAAASPTVRDSLLSASPRSVPTPGPLAARTLHVLNGDTVTERLKAAGIEGQITLSADPLYEGPATPASSPERWRRERARFLAECGYEDYDSCLARLTGWDRPLEGFRAYDHVVLWFEHDLFDQLQLCRLLAWFASRDNGLTRISLVQAGDYLGRMPIPQIAALYEARQPVTTAQNRLAATAWDAFCAPSPAPLGALAALIEAAGETAALPYLAAALRRHCEEFPATDDGLPRTERQVLVALAGGPLAFAHLFSAVQRMEERVFMTDLSLWGRLRELAAGPRPLIHLGPHAGAIDITPTGRLVLAGGADWIELRGGIDRWLGGVHLQGRQAAWRWQRTAGRLVADREAGSRSGG